MTKENGKVGVAMQVPLLGTVTGVKTIEEITTGRKASLSPGPAVDSKPMPGKAKSLSASAKQ